MNGIFRSFILIYLFLLLFVVDEAGTGRRRRKKLPEHTEDLVRNSPLLCGSGNYIGSVRNEKLACSIKHSFYVDLTSHYEEAIVHGRNANQNDVRTEKPKRPGVSPEDVDRFVWLKTETTKELTYLGEIVLGELLENLTRLVSPISPGDLNRAELALMEQRLTFIIVDSDWINRVNNHTTCLPLVRRSNAPAPEDTKICRKRVSSVIQSISDVIRLNINPSDDRIPHMIHRLKSGGLDLENIQEQPGGEDLIFDGADWAQPFWDLTLQAVIQLTLVFSKIVQENILDLLTRIMVDVNDRILLKLEPAKFEIWDAISYLQDLAGRFRELKRKVDLDVEMGGTAADLIDVAKQILLGLPMNMSITEVAPYLNYQADIYAMIYKLCQDQSFIPLIVEPAQLAQLLNHPVKMIEDELQWCRLLLDLMDELQSYPIQFQHVGNYKDWAAQTGVDGRSNTEVTMASFPNVFEKFSHTKALHSRNQTIVEGWLSVNTVKKLADLSSVLEFCLKSPPAEIKTVAAPDIPAHLPVSTVAVEAAGRFVAVSEVLEYVESIKMSANVKKVTIVSVNKLYLENDITGSQFLFATWDKTGFDVEMVSTILSVTGGRVFNLNGLDGRDPDPQSTFPYRGMDGYPGDPGGNAGSVFVLGQYLEGSSELIINANGGRGGSGQDGQMGSNGGQGRDVDMDLVRCRANEVKPNSIALEPHFDDVVPYTFLSSYNLTRKEEWRNHYHIFGTAGGGGLKGGDGGQGGIGGHGGTVNFVILDSSAINVTISSRMGENGTDGVFGEGGKGGWSGNGKIVLLVPIKSLRPSSPIKCKVLSLETTGPVQQSDVGANGITGGKAAYPPTTLRYKITQSHKPILTLKNRMRAQAVGPEAVLISSTKARAFLRRLDENPAVRSTDSTLGLMEEFMDIVKQQYTGLPDQKVKNATRSRTIFTEAYESVWNRTQDQINRLSKGRQPNPSKFSDEDICLAQLAQVCISEVNNLKINKEQYLVLHLESYFETLTDSMSKIKEQTIKQYQLTNIKKRQDEYDTRIKRMGSKTNDFIESTALPDMKNLGNEVDRYLVKFVDELEAEISKKITNAKEMNKAAKNLEEQLVTHALFGVLKVACLMVSFFGPLGMCVGVAASAGIGIAEAYLPPATPPGNDVWNIPQNLKNGLKAASDSITRFKEKNVQDFSNQLDAVNEQLKMEIKNDPDEFKLIKEKIDNFEIKMKELEKKRKKQAKLVAVSPLDPGPLSELADTGTLIRSCKEDLMAALETKKKLLEDAKSTANAGTLPKIEQKLKSVGVAVQLAQMSGEVYNKFKNDKNKLQQVLNQTNVAYKNINRLEKKLMPIHQVFSEVGRKMRRTLEQFQMGLNGTQSSRIGLKIGQWEIKGAFDKLRDTLDHGLIKGLKMGPVILKLMDRLEEMLKEVGRLFELMEHYNEQSQMTHLITSIASTTIDSKLIKDVTYRNASLSLEVFYHTSFLVGQFSRAVKSFQQFTFPLHKLYMQDVPHPEELPMGNELGPDDDSRFYNLAAIIIGYLEKLKIGLKNYQKDNRNYRNYLRRQDFRPYPWKKSLPEFFMWNHQIHKSEINQLLQIQPAVLTSHVAMSPEDKSAIKFSKIDLEFQVEGNETLTADLREILDGRVEVELIHMGDSVYRFRNETFLIQSVASNIDFSLGKGFGGYPFMTGGRYDALMNSDIVLSPYATWKIELVITPPTDLEKTSKDEIKKKLAKFVDLRVNVALVGLGSYVLERTAPAHSLTSVTSHGGDDQKMFPSELIQETFEDCAYLRMPTAFENYYSLNA